MITIPDQTYRWRVDEQILKVVPMLDYIFKKNPEAMEGIKRYNVIDDVAVLLANGTEEDIVLRCGEVLAKEMMLYFALPEIEDYERAERFRKIFEGKVHIIEENKVSL